MENISANQLALIMDIPKKDAAKKIIVALERSYGNDKILYPGDMDRHEKNPSISIQKMSKYLGCDLVAYLNNIKTNYLKNQSTKKFILDYPLTKLKPNKDSGLLPKTVTIPAALKSLLTAEQCNEIVNKWRELYKSYTEAHGVLFK